MPGSMLLGQNLPERRNVVPDDLPIRIFVVSPSRQVMQRGTTRQKESIYDARIFIYDSFCGGDLGGRCGFESSSAGVTPLGVNGIDVA